jgi:hypothetical protein
LGGRRLCGGGHDQTGGDKGKTDDYERRTPQASSEISRSFSEWSTVSPPMDERCHSSQTPFPIS